MRVSLPQLAAAALLFVSYNQCLSASTTYAVLTTGDVYRSNDSAKTWQRVPVAPDDAAGTLGDTTLAVDPQDPTRLFYVRSKAADRASRVVLQLLYRSSDGGSTWTKSSAPALSVLYGSLRLRIDPSSRNTLYLAAGEGLYKSTDAGDSWEKSPLAGPVWCVIPDPNHPGVIYACATTVGEEGIYKSIDFGVTWSLLARFPATVIVYDIAIDPRSNTTLYAAGMGTCGGSACGLFRSTNGGNSWDRFTVPGVFRNVVFDARTHAIYAGGALLPTAERGQVIRSTDDGKTWTQLNEGLSDSVMEVQVDPESDSSLFAHEALRRSSQRGGIFVRQGAAWARATIGSPASAVDALVFASGVTAPTPPPGGRTPQTYTFRKIFETMAAETVVSGPIALNNNGTVAFVELPSATLYAGTGADDLIKIADTSGPFSQIKVTSINNSGVVTFVAELKDGSVGVYTGSADGVTQIATTATGTSMYFLTANPSINDRGDVVFLAGSKIMISSEGQLRTVTETDIAALTAIGHLNEQSVVAFSAVRLDFTSAVYSQGEGQQRVTIAGRPGLFGIAPGPSINDSGTVAFVGLSADASHAVVYSGSGGELITVADTTDLQYFPHVSINNAGTILMNAGSTSSRLYLLTGPDPVADRVIVVGDPLFESTAAYVEANPFEGGRVINDRGEVAFRYMVGDRAGIAIATPGGKPGDGTSIRMEHFGWI